MRARPGDRVVLFDGSGAEFTAQVERIARSEVHLAVLDRAQVDRELPFELTLAAALPKGDRQKWLVEKAVELGAAKLVPLVTTRSIAAAPTNTGARLARWVVEASKQCGRNRLMQITQPEHWGRFVDMTGNIPTRLIAHPSTDLQEATVGCLRKEASQPVALAVGPEGGFTDNEVELAVEHGWQPIHLGPRTLRIETAAVLLIALIVQSDG
jgi:16S rRNA (uracil1498-N3)-methyltransferase